MKVQNFESLPIEVQEDVRNTLKAYNEVHIVFEYGRYNVSTCIALCATYAPDRKVIGDVHKDEIYTKDEQILNYIDTFNDYPIEYKGSRNYDVLRQLKAAQIERRPYTLSLKDGKLGVIYNEI